MSSFDVDLDTPIYGVRAIARVLNLIDDHGEVDERRGYYVLEQGHVDASKVGRVWASTKRRLLAPHLAHITA
jgi:hypothetical protein